MNQSSSPRELPTLLQAPSLNRTHATAAVGKRSSPPPMNRDAKSAHVGLCPTINSLCGAPSMSLITSSTAFSTRAVKLRNSDDVAPPPAGIRSQARGRARPHRRRGQYEIGMKPGCAEKSPDLCRRLHSALRQRSLVIGQVRQVPARFAVAHEHQDRHHKAPNRANVSEAYRQYATTLTPFSIDSRA